VLKKVLSIGIVGLVSACGGAGVPVLNLSSNNNDLANATLGPASLASIEPAAKFEDANFASLLNGMRVASDLEPLTYDDRLNSAAQKHAQDMVDNDYFSHRSLDGRTVPERIEAEGYNARGWGENIAGGQQSDQQALDAWINSPPHNALLNASTLNDFALGVAGSGSKIRWVLLMAAER
jgi:uncharacterized protein YkwD